MSYIPQTFLILIVLSFTSFGYSQNNIQKEKSVIVITKPNQNTVWTIPDRVNLNWSTIGIDSLKSIRFFLAKNDLVVQELGSFRNIQSKEGIKLATNISSGDTYQVVGIELFPDNKYQIAKFATPFFTIANPASDERKQKQALANSYVSSNTNKKQKKQKPQKTETTKAVSTANNEVKPYTRTEFNGRKISYTKELQFDSENIRIKIWDHGRQDGDIVSIYLNGVSIVSKHYLTYFKREFDVKLNSNISNDLFLYAHNLGTAPPNTVSVEITDGNKSEIIILNSDLQSCEAVLINVKK